MQRVVDIQMTFVMDDVNHFHSTCTLSKIYYYDPTTGQGQAGNPIVVPDATVTTAERLNTRRTSRRGRSRRRPPRHGTLRHGTPNTGGH